MRNRGAHDPPRQLRETVRRMLELPRLQQLLPAAATGSHRAHGGTVQGLWPSRDQGHLPRPTALGPLPEHAMPCEGGKAEESGQAEGSCETSVAEEGDAGADCTGPPHWLGRPHETSEFVACPRLKRVIRPLLFADCGRSTLAVMMARTDDEGVVHFAYFIEERSVHLLHA